MNIEQGHALLPCPFCGGEAKLVIAVGQPKSYFVDCQSCEMATNNHRAESESIAAWNRRAALQSQDREYALIETILEACDEWSGYVEVDNAPRTLREHIKLVIDHARRIEGES